MNPRFAQAIDPIFLYVLDILDQISGGTVGPPQEIRDHVRNLFHDADSHLEGREGWPLAKFALVAWIDDVLIEAPWSGRDWWENNSLEFAFFKTRDRATEFFLKARQAAELHRRDALEVFYVSVVLGFRGLYNLSEGAFLADQLQLPPDIHQWARQVARSIQLGQGRPPIQELPRPAEGAPPLEGKFLLVGTALVGVILAAFTTVVGFYVFVWSH